MTLPDEQLQKLLGWSEEKLAFHLREDDFLWIKLGSLKPSCPELRWEAIDDSSRARLDEIREVVEAVIGRRGLRGFENPLRFLAEIQDRNERLPARSAGGALPGEVSLDRPVNVFLPAEARSGEHPALLEAARSFRWHLEHQNGKQVTSFLEGVGENLGLIRAADILFAYPANENIQVG